MHFAGCSDVKQANQQRNIYFPEVHNARLQRPWCSSLVQRLLSQCGCTYYCLRRFVREMHFTGCLDVYTEVFKRTNCISIEAMLLKSCLRWTGHVIRMEDQRIPKQLLFGELEQGHRRQGRPCKRFKDTVKAGLQWCDIPPTELVATALDRQRWRTLTQSASSALEEERRHQAQSARERRHLAACIPATNANFQCPECARLCKSRIGLQSHSRTHR